MATETTYNVIKVQELRAISSATGSDEIIINDVDSTPLETKKITAENLALSLKDYILPIASAEVLGGIRVGNGLSINPATGVLSNDIYYLSDLNDVQVSSPQANQVLTYDGAKWTNIASESVVNIIAGDGLSGGGSGPQVILNVNPGDGLSISNDRINVNAGLGLLISNDVIVVDVNSSLTFVGNKLSVNPNVGLIVDNEGLSVNYGRGLVTFGPLLEANIGQGLKFVDNKITVNIGDSFEFDQNVLNLKFASEEDTLAFVIDDQAVSPATLGYTVGKAEGICGLNPVAQVYLDNVPKLPANKLKTIPQPWQVGADNFADTANFTHVHNSGAVINLFTTPTSDYVGDSGFIYVKNPNKIPLTGINDAMWRGINNTWYNVETNSFGLPFDIIIGYYIAEEGVILYSASGIQ